MTQGSSRNLISALMLVMAAALSACAAGVAATTTTAPQGTTTVAPSTSTIGPTTTAVGSVPAELAGTWTGEHPTNGEAVSLGLNGTTWSLAWAATPGVGGGLLVDGDTIVFSGVYECPGEFAYNWSIQNGELTLTPIGEDPCPRGSIINKVVFTRAAGG
jgi:hypothetical protein